MTTVLPKETDNLLQLQIQLLADKLKEGSIKCVSYNSDRIKTSMGYMRMTLISFMEIEPLTDEEKP
jgi:hypothetical protein